MALYEIYKRLGSISRKVFPSKILSVRDSRLERSLRYLSLDIGVEDIVGSSLLIALIVLTSSLLTIQALMRSFLFALVLSTVLAYMAFKLSYEMPVMMSHDKAFRELRTVIPIAEEAITRYLEEGTALVELIAHNDILLDEEELTQLRLGMAPEDVLLRKTRKVALNEALAHTYRTLASLTQSDISMIEERRGGIEELTNEICRRLERRLSSIETYTISILTLGFFMPLLAAMATIFGMIPVDVLPYTVIAYMAILTLTLRFLRGD